MTIVPIPAENCSSVVDFWNRGGKVAVPRPRQCLNAICMLVAPLRKNGSYLRQVVYWGIVFTVMIARFRFRKCGGTISCPYSWLVPYRRFAAELIAAAIEAYAETKVTYRAASTELSDLDFVEPEFDIRKTESFKMLATSEEAKGADSIDLKIPIKPEGIPQGIAILKNKQNEDGSDVQHPVPTTVFYWVNYICKQAERFLIQIQKEFVLEWKRSHRKLRLRAATDVSNPNAEKACSLAKGESLKQVTMLSWAAKDLIGEKRRQWQKLRTYFLLRAESCNDILTLTKVALKSTHSFQFDLF